MYRDNISYYIFQDIKEPQTQIMNYINFFKISLYLFIFQHLNNGVRNNLFQWNKVALNLLTIIYRHQVEVITNISWGNRPISIMEEQ